MFPKRRDSRGNMITSCIDTDLNTNEIISEMQRVFNASIPTGKLTIHHSSTFECRDCGKNYRHSNNLHRHRRFECGKEPQFMCPYCKYKAKLKDNLKKHVVYKHKTNF